jgi:hypothetical protein
MNRTSIATAALSLALSLSGMAQANVQTANLSTPMSARQLNDLIRSAHSTTEYKELASYYHQQEAQYRAEASAEKAERDRRAQVNAGLMQKYPRPVDSAQYLYESYVSKADGAALQARHYDQLAGTPIEQNPQTATNSQGKS